MLVTPSRRTALVALTLFLLVGCAGSKDRLVISSTTVLGLDASVNTARTAGHVQLGYDRYFVTWVPQTVSVKNQTGLEAMSALNCTDVVVGGLQLKKFSEALATGTAAAEFAKHFNAREKDAYFDCFYPPAQGTR